MSLGYHIISGITWGLLKLTCKFKVEDFSEVPEEGPFILAFNHINFLEAPLLRLALRPRNVKAMVKQELTNNFVMRYLSRIWGGIPVKRGGNPRDSFSAAGDFLNDKGILCVAPEGTRSKNGKLQKAHGGIVIMAHRFQVPVLPVAHYGGEQYWKNLLRFKRTAITIKIGEMIPPCQGERLKKSQREEELLKIMKALASLMPEEYRGFYA